MRIAADDVGAGNAGLRLLSQLRFDIVKIDLSLVQGGVVRATSQEVVLTLKDLADRWGALVIAEGVETVEQLEFVRSLGIRAGQGYLLGVPIGATVDRCRSTSTPSSDRPACGSAVVAIRLRLRRRRLSGQERTYRQTQDHRGNVDGSSQPC